MRAAKIDANQTQIVSALRAAGANVQSLSGVGKGVPDLLVGINGVLALFEVKDGQKCKSAQKLTPDQVNWHKKWAGFPVCLVDGPDAAIRHLNVLRGMK